MGLTNQSTGFDTYNKDIIEEINLLRIPKEKNFVIALAGNPNTGKSTVFNALTGLKQHTGNWTGKTVTTAKGFYNYKKEKYTLIDLPGTYSLIPTSAEEEVAKDFILKAKPDVTVVVVDATCLERNLNLVLQIMELTPHVVVCINLMDEARNKGLNIDVRKLSDYLGVPVVGTSARQGEGLEELMYTISLVANRKVIPNPIKIDYNLPDDISEEEKQDIIMYKIFTLSEGIMNNVVEQLDIHKGKKDLTQRLDNIFISKKFGIPAMLALLGIIFWITIEGANYPSNLLYNLFFTIEEKLIDFSVSNNVPNWIFEPIILGVYRTLAWVVSVMLPPMAIFFPLFTLLEDFGYLPRIAFNLDNFFKRACAHGKQALTMCMGFGCNAAGVIGCRIIDSPRERLIAIITNAFVPCNGRFPSLISITSIFIVGTIGLSHYLKSAISVLTILGIIILGIVITLLTSKILSKTKLKGLPSSFTLELPPYRKPQIGRILVRSVLDRTIFVLGRAIMVAAPAGILIWIVANININNISILDHFANFLNPFASFVGLDGYILMAFILGLPANEIVVPILIMSYLSSGTMLELSNLTELGQLLVNNGWTGLTAINFMLFCLCHFPCGTTLLTIKKETKSIKWTFLSFIIPTAVGLGLCALTTFIYRIFQYFF